ncbi:hypothetical protein LTR53_008111 [Teratosphaeriaceae sp. CCFEE 6253]|nr:hypothetical protein LTR53_008111 [Teratosphaeriaceae sp. CCFEE 6253]
MRTILLPTGPPGSGKSTLTNGLQQFLLAIARPCSVANLDPANPNIPYAAAFDVRDLVSVEEVMEREELGPNGGVLWAMEEVEANFEWLEEQLERCEETIVLDPPGQPELMVHHTALPRILHRLEKIGYRSCTDGNGVNILTKIDTLAAHGGRDLPFNLDFYTEVQDLPRLLPLLAAEQPTTTPQAADRWERLNTALIDLITDFGLVGFETLAVEDRQSMAALLRAIDRASGYVFAGARGKNAGGGTVEDEGSLWAQAMAASWGQMEVRDVQERWIDRKEEGDEAERKLWEEEAREAGALPKTADGGGEADVAAAVRSTGTDQGGKGEEEDEMLVEQRRWAEEREKGGGTDAGGVKVVKKG